MSLNGIGPKSPEEASRVTSDVQDTNEAADSARPLQVTVRSDAPHDRIEDEPLQRVRPEATLPALPPRGSNRVGVSLGAGYFDGNNLNRASTHPALGTNSANVRVGIEGARDLGDNGRFSVGAGLYRSHAALDQFADSHPGAGTVTSDELLVRARIQSSDRDSSVRAFFGPTLGMTRNRAKFEGTLSFDPSSSIAFDSTTYTWTYGAELGARAALAGGFEAELALRYRSGGDNQHPWTVNRPDGTVITGNQAYHATEAGVVASVHRVF